MSELNHVQSLMQEFFSGFTIEKATGTCTKNVSAEGASKKKFTFSPSKHEQTDYLLISKKQNFSDIESELLLYLNEEWRSDLDFFKNNEKYFPIYFRHGLFNTISKYISKTSWNFIAEAVNTLIAWSSQTYEGQRIAFSIGIDETTTKQQLNTVNFKSIENNDFLKVMTSGHDTLLTTDKNGSVVGHYVLENGDTTNTFSPLAFSNTAYWTSNAEKHAICLTRAGEIFIFTKGSLLFAIRRGKWIVFQHDLYVQGMEPQKGKRDKEIRTQIYLSMLDMSFKKTGACIGYCCDDQIDNIAQIISSDDLLKKSSSTKAIFFRKLIGKNKFHELNRKLRQELLSIDGATIITVDGTILAVGAILQLSGGSTGGGRTAAAKALSEYGIGIKVSNDGKIEYWRNSSTDPVHSIG